MSDAEDFAEPEGTSEVEDEDSESEEESGKEEDDGEDEPDTGSVADPPGPGRSSEERFNWPGPPWSAGKPEGALPADVKVVVVPDDERITSDTISLFELAKVSSVMANYERRSDDVVHGAMRKAYSGKTPLTIVRTISLVGATYHPNGQLKSRGVQTVEIWRVAELINPHPLPKDISL